MKIVINGKECEVCDVKPSYLGWVNLYINNFSTCHSVPSNWWYDENDLRIVRTGSHTYRKLKG